MRKYSSGEKIPTLLIIFLRPDIENDIVCCVRRAVPLLFSASTLDLQSFKWKVIQILQSMILIKTLLLSTLFNNVGVHLSIKEKEILFPLMNEQIC